MVLLFVRARRSLIASSTTDLPDFMGRNTHHFVAPTTAVGEFCDCLSIPYCIIKPVTFEAAKIEP